MALCGNFSSYLVAYQITPSRAIEEISNFKSLLLKDFADYNYPFDTQYDFDKACREKTHHLNPRRLAWVRKKIEEYDDTAEV